MSPTANWGARPWPPPASLYPGFLQEQHPEIPGPVPNERLAALYYAFWLELDRDIADMIFTPNPAHDTISHFAALAAHAGVGWGRALCALLDEIDSGHCARAKAKDGTA